MYLAVTTVRDRKCLANNKRARRQTRIRLQNYRLRNFEPWGRAPTGEDLFDQGICLEQSFGFDKSVIYYGLRYVMPYDPLLVMPQEAVSLVTANARETDYSARNVTRYMVGSRT